MKFTASDIMSSPAISVHPDDTLKEVIQLFAKHNISGAPVVNENNELVGIITERDIIDFSGQSHVVSLLDTSGWISPHTDTKDIASLKEGFELVTSVRVKSQMSRKVYTVKQNTPGQEVARIMKKRKIDRVPVVDEEGHLLGIITRSNLVNKLAEL